MMGTMVWNGKGMSMRIWGKLTRSSCRPQVIMKKRNPENISKKTAETLVGHERESNLGGTWVGMQNIEISAKTHGYWQWRAGGAPRGGCRGNSSRRGKPQGAEEHKEPSCLCLVSDVPAKQWKNGKQKEFCTQVFALCPVSCYTVIKMLYTLLTFSKQCLFFRASSHNSKCSG